MARLDPRERADWRVRTPGAAALRAADAAGGRGGGVVRQDGDEADWGEMGHGPCRAMDGPSVVSSHLLRMGKYLYLSFYLFLGGV